MSRGWNHRGGERYAVPVEMRFVDMFMAALGALIFMAMLLAFLLKFIPPPAQRDQPQRIAPATTLHLLSRQLAPARAGEAYEYAFAYRGGRGGVAWELVGGASDVAPDLRFDASQGTLSGTPAGARTVRFVVRVRDGDGQVDQRPFELTVEAPRTGSRRIEHWLAGVMLVILAIVWIMTRLAAGMLGHQVLEMQEAHAEGHSTYEVHSGPFVKEVVKLPEGITVYQARNRATLQISRYLLLTVLALGVWFIWRLRVG